MMGFEGFVSQNKIEEIAEYYQHPKKRNYQSISIFRYKKS